MKKVIKMIAIFLAIFCTFGLFAKITNTHLFENKKKKANTDVEANFNEYMYEHNVKLTSGSNTAEFVFYSDVKTPYENMIDIPTEKYEYHTAVLNGQINIFKWANIYDPGEEYVDVGTAKFTFATTTVVDTVVSYGLIDENQECDTYMYMHSLDLYECGNQEHFIFDLLCDYENEFTTSTFTTYAKDNNFHTGCNVTSTNHQNCCGAILGCDGWDFTTFDECCVNRQWPVADLDRVSDTVVKYGRIG